MTAVFEGPGFGGPEFDLDNDLPGSLRAGLETLRLAAPRAGLSVDTVDAVVSSAWDAFAGFSGRDVGEYNSVVALAIGVNGWAWVEAMLVDPAPREAWFRFVTAQARLFGHKHFPRLPEADREAAADDAMLRLSGRMVNSLGGSTRIPMWTVWPIVTRNARWLLLTAARNFDRDHADRDGGSTVMSLDSYFETFGEHGVRSIDFGAAAVEDRGVEAAVWAAALDALKSRASALVTRARAGAARNRATVTVEAAKWVLSKGSEDSVSESGRFDPGSAEEVRQKYAQDSLLVCFHGLRAASPERWGAYPDDMVPTREVIDQVGNEAMTRGDAQAAWFTKLEARRVDVAKSDRVLHSIRSLVESLIRDATQDAKI